MSPSQSPRARWLLRLVAGQVAGIGLFGLGFWLLYQAFLKSNVLFGVLGGLLVPLGMWAMARSRRAASGGDK